jgi:protein-disulfide isomerase
VRPTLDEIQKKYGKDVRIVYKQFVVHPQVATAAALAVCAASKQGKFEKMDELVWEKAFKTRQFDEAHFADLAKEAGLDMGRYAADVKGDCNAFIQKDQSELQTFGVGATPAFFINGRFLSGAQPLPAFDALVADELKKANERIAQGTAAADYYKTFVIEKGLKKLAAPNAEAVPAH